jgi:DNA primase
MLSIAQESVRLSPQGQEWRGHCPFHAARRRPTFCVVPEKQSFRCQSCGAEGDAIDFVMKLKRCGFKEAVAIISARFMQQADPVLQALEEATAFYERALWESPAAELAREHLRQRGILEKTARAWRLGFAPAQWTGLVDALSRSGITAATLEAAGLAIPRSSGNGHYDLFRSRLVIPIRKDGRIVGFGGRFIGNGEQPKYLNSPETTYFRKGETLFGLDECAGAFRGGQRAIVVEGYFDVIALHQAGVQSAVAVCGSATNETHLAALLEAGARKACFAFDGDQAGRSAAARAATLALGSACHASVLQCPEGLDPDELVQRDGRDGFLEQVAGASSCADFLISHDLGGFTARHAVEARVAALYRLAGQFEAAGARFTAAQTRRLASLVGCEQSTMERALEPRGLLEHT